MKRFWDKVVKTDSCWLWTGCLCRGYGLIKASNGMRRAHRVSWELHFGPIPEDLYVCHQCDVRKCVNPSHLFLGTHTDNMRDMTKKGRHARRQNTAKLTYDEVDAIRALRGKLNQRDIGWLFGVHQTAVGHIHRGTSYPERLRPPAQ